MIPLARPPCPNPEALKTNYKHPDNKRALQTACADKCMYCESKVTATYFGDVEHIKPVDRFPQLKYAWGNLGYVCAICNNSKRAKWSEETPFINPFDEDPNEHLAALGFLVSHRRGSERGEYTHIEIDLNRLELVERRRERAIFLRNLYDKAMRTINVALRTAALAELDRELESDKEYSMVIKAAIAAIK
jgi:HNH endonuclease